MLSAVMKKPLCQTKWLKRNNFSSGKTEKTASILWSHITNTDLVKRNETQPIQRKCDITNFFTKIPSSKSTEKKTEATQVPSRKKIKKEEEVKKEEMERPKKRRIRRTIIALENMKGMLLIVASLIKNGQRKILAFSQSKKTPSLFSWTICSKKVSCSHQAFGDVVRHCKTALHIKFRDEMDRQEKIEKPDDLSKKEGIFFEFRLSRDKL